MTNPRHILTRTAHRTAIVVSGVELNRQDMTLNGLDAAGPCEDGHRGNHV